MSKVSVLQRNHYPKTRANENDENCTEINEVRIVLYYIGSNVLALAVDRIISEIKCRKIGPTT